MSHHPLTNSEKQKYQNKPKFNSVCSRNNLTKIKDAVYIKNPVEYEAISAHWIALYMIVENVTYSDSFGV